ncbi:hypothetical protein ANME2D_00967 [Candidatus Methanoperedens nitroreducens]|uniref:Uncharacterized protein n=1 Tax=Candidatus Methanoperedens nitratireducens TaxID=1392998 RepID=A0A062V7L1_9EURY|nr:hypothetical protein [Candidatus Methanoperedens nitroreducens]KCZ72538.1 hypothetical protein ANME2D_00967 [Candidatus Methanoperedens nitroreducens]MDJ1423528.1 hypothetical protein [Candidatus Methanoperedens sp.]
MLTKILNLVVALLLFSVLFIAVDDSYSIWSGKEEAIHIGVEEIAGGPDIGGGIFSDFILSFEVLALLLITALIGALYIAKKEAF